MSKRILGLDLGITSIGWAVVEYDKHDSSLNKILDSGVRIFTEAEHPDGSSLAKPRRDARGARRVTKRRVKRIQAIKRLLIDRGIVTYEIYDSLFMGNKGQKDVWQLRAEALYRALLPTELARVLIHLAKHRSYQSNRKNSSTDDKEGKKVLLGIQENELAMQASQSQTIGEHFFKQTKKRNSKDSYSCSISRDMLRSEIATIFEKQDQFNNPFATKAFLKEYEKLAFTQRPFTSVEKMVGVCPFEPPEPRASKSTITFETFRALQVLNNLRLETPEGETTLNHDDISLLIQEAKTKKSLSYKQVRKFLKLDESALFKTINYFDKEGELIKTAENPKVLEFTGFHTLKKAIEACDKSFWLSIKDNNVLLDNIATILTVEKDETKIIDKLQQYLDREDVVHSLSGISFSKFGHISLKALYKINEKLAEGFDYDKACLDVGYDFKAIFKGDKQRFLPALTEQEKAEMTNPVVKRAIAQLRKVFNAIVRKHGDFDAVHVELTRDIKKSHKDRDDIKKGQKDFQAEKERAKERFKQYAGNEPSPKELLKFRLLEQQNNRCIYSNEYIDAKKLLDAHYCEVDHILPYSRSMDDSLNNKVLCLAKENQQKGNKTPFEYFGSNKENEKWLDFVGRVHAIKQIRKAKKERLLKTNFDTSSENSFKERNKNDTSYITSFVKNFIEAHISFKPSKHKQHVVSINGMLTTQLRLKWGVGSKNRDNHLHHAEDAIIVAFATQSEVQKLSTTSSIREEKGWIYKSKEDKAKYLHFKAPMEHFNAVVQKSVGSIFVSHMPRKKVTGAAHEATIYSHKTLSVKKADNKIDELKGNSRTHNVKLKHGVAKNDGMPRVDVFQHVVSKKYYLVPIYVSDFVKDTLPNKAIVAGNKPWIEMSEDYGFCFSLYKSELIEIKTKKTSKKESQQIMGYYDKTHSGTANISLKSNDGSSAYSFGSQNLIFIKKYQVNPLGDYVEVKQETRQGSIKENWQDKLQKRKKLRQERKQQNVAK